MFKKLFSSLIKLLIGLIVAVLGTVFFIVIVRSLAIVSLDVFKAMLTITENKEAMIFDIMNFNYKQLIGATLSGFICSFVFASISYLILFAFAQLPEKYSINTESISKLIWKITTILFFVLTLIFWLDEKGFMIATAVISFAALLKDPVEKYWESHF